MNPQKDVRYILYARKSSESEDRQMASINDQVEVMKQFAERHNLSVVDIIQESKSAKTPRGRAGFQELLNRIHSGEAGRFLSQDPASLYEPERFLRDPQQLNMYSYVANNPVGFVDPTGESRMFASLVGNLKRAFSFSGGQQMLSNDLQVTAVAAKRVAVTTATAAVAASSAAVMGPQIATALASEAGQFGTIGAMANTLQRGVEDYREDGVINHSGVQYGFGAMFGAAEGVLFGGSNLVTTIGGAGLISLLEQEALDVGFNWADVGYDAAGAGVAKGVFDLSGLGSLISSASSNFASNLSEAVAGVAASIGIKESIEHD